MRLVIYIEGQPQPQGSKRHVGGGRMIESAKGLPDWRAKVSVHTVAAIIKDERLNGTSWPATGPVSLMVTFHLQRPKHHYRTGKFSDQLKTTAPTRVQVGADLDKLVRAIGDSLTDAGAVIDDKQIEMIHASKVWTEAPPYCVVVLETVDDG